MPSVKPKSARKCRPRPSKAEAHKAEVRGMVVRVWSSAPFGPWSFEPLDGGSSRSIKVPIGWSFQPHEVLGVVLRHTLASRAPVHAAMALAMALRVQDGFRVLGKPEDEDRDDIG